MALKNQRNRSGQKGSVALEYVMVSVFAMLVGAALLAVMVFVLEAKLEEISQSLDIPIDTSFLQRLRGKS